MKKFLGIIMAATMVVGLVACADSSTKQDATAMNQGTQAGQVTEAVTETTQETTTVTNAVITEQIIRDLVQDNLTCMYDIFILHTLPIQGSMVEGQWIYPVDENEFANYAELDTFVRNIYTKETADRYMLNFPYEGDPKYLNQDGKLYVNMMYDGGKGYYVDWSNYTVTIDSQSDGRCEFTLHAKVEWPAEKPVLEDYDVKGTAVYEDGKWVLTDMLS